MRALISNSRRVYRPFSKWPDDAPESRPHLIATNGHNTALNVLRPSATEGPGAMNIPRCQAGPGPPRKHPCWTLIGRAGAGGNVGDCFWGRA